jgi:hypothetical protein
MVKSTKTQCLRERMHADIKRCKQTTLSNLAEDQKTKTPIVTAPEQKKQIEIIEIDTSTRENELSLKIGFRLLPSRTAFSKVTSELYFDKQKINSLCLRVLQGPLATNESEYSTVLDMRGIEAGQHMLGVEIDELWGSGEKLAAVSKELAIEYIPLRREDRLVRVPIVKSVEGTDLAIVSDIEKGIYREMAENIRKELVSKRDEW